MIRAKIAEARWLFTSMTSYFCASFLLLADRDQLDVKDKSFTGTDVSTCAAIAVGEIGGNEELPLRSDRHQLQRFGPALDHASDGKRSRLSTLVRAVEFFAVDQRAAIIDGDRIGRCGLRTCAFGQNLVLQTVGKNVCTPGFDLLAARKSSPCFRAAAPSV